VIAQGDRQACSSRFVRIRDLSFDTAQGRTLRTGMNQPALIVVVSRPGPGDIQRLLSNVTI
jgi:hypothetical protein